MAACALTEADSVPCPSALVETQKCYPLGGAHSLLEGLCFQWAEVKAPLRVLVWTRVAITGFFAPLQKQNSKQLLEACPKLVLPVRESPPS